MVRVDKTKPEHWEVSLRKEEIESCRSDPRFAAVLTLARIVNSLMFFSHALLEGSKAGNPSGSRQHVNALLFSAGTLYEALDEAERVGSVLGDNESYRRGLQKLLDDPKTKELRAKALLRLRNQIVFHFDPKVASKALKKLDLPAYQFATGDGPRRGDTYYPLADEVAINYIIEVLGGEGVELQTWKELLVGIRDLLTKFIDASESLIADVLKELGWTIRERKSQVSD